MLVLTRRTDADKDHREVTITVPPSTESTKVRVVLVRVKNSNQAQIGFVAPDYVTISRNELLAPLLPTHDLGGSD